MTERPKELDDFSKYFFPSPIVRRETEGVGGITASQNRETTRLEDGGLFESKNTNDPANPARESADILDVLLTNTTTRTLDPVIIVSADKRGRGGGGRIDWVKLWQTHERKRNNDDDAPARLLINFRLIKRNGARYEARRRSREFGRRKKVGGGESVASERSMDRSREERGSAPPRGEPSVRQTHASHTAKGSKPGGKERRNESRGGRARSAGER